MSLHDCPGQTELVSGGVLLVCAPAANAIINCVTVKYVRVVIGILIAVDGTNISQRILGQWDEASPGGSEVL